MPCLPFEPENSIAWPPDADYGDAQAFGRMVVAELDGDQAADGVVLAGGVAVVLWKIALYEAPQPILFPTQPPPTSVADVVTLPGAGPDGTDGLLMTDERGLFLVTYDSALEGFQDPILIADGAWVDAKPLHVDDLDGDGDLDLLGVSADQNTLLTRLAQGTTLGPGLTVTTPTLRHTDLIAADWNGDGSRELVTRTNRGLHVFDPSGTLLTSVAYLTPVGCITRFHALDSPEQELVAWTRGAGAASELVVLADGHQEGPWTLTFDTCGPLVTIQPTALLSGDYDEDQNEELLLVYQGNCTAIVLANIGKDEPPPSGPSGPHFDPFNGGFYDVVSLAPNPLDSGGVGIPAFDQIDGDGSVDIAFPMRATLRVEVFLSLPYYRALTHGPPSSDEIVAPQTEYGPGTTGPPRLRFAFELPPRYQGYTHIEVILWEQYDPGTSDLLAPDPLCHRRHKFDPTHPANQYPRQWVEVESDFQSGACWDETRPRFYTEYRFVKLATNGTHLAPPSPPYAGGFTLKACFGANDFDQLLIQGIPGTEFNLYEHNGLTTPPPGGTAREVVGVYVPMSSTPPFLSTPHPGNPIDSYFAARYFDI